MKNNSLISKLLNLLFKVDDGTRASVTANTTDTNCQSEEAVTKQETSSSKSAGETDDEKTHKADFTPAKVIRALGVELIQSQNENLHIVGFQGGNFVLSFENERLDVMYDSPYECTYQDSLKALFIMNNINSIYSVWSPFMRIESRVKSETPIKICFSQMFPLIGSFDESIQFIRGMLASVFLIAREFKVEFDKALKDRNDLAILMNHKDFLHHLDLSKRLMEVGNWDKYQDEKPDSSFLQVQSLLNMLDDTEFGTPKLMKILVSDEVEKIDNIDQILSFNIREYIRNHPNREEIETLTFLVSCESQDLVINMKKMPGSSSRTLFFMMSGMRSGVESDLLTQSSSALNFRTTVEIRLTSSEDDYWEVKYMLTDAKNKQEKNQQSSLTAEQKIMLIQMLPSAQDDLYWGLKYFNQKCWYQSLFYFKRIFYNLLQVTPDKKREEALIADVCFYIGVTYFHLKMYDRAYYYLDRARQGRTLAPIEWFAECLIRMKDPLASIYLKQILLAYAKEIRNSDENYELNYKLYRSMKKKFIVALINEGKFNKAKKLLDVMSKNEEDKYFVIKQLKIIQYYRKLAEERQNESVNQNSEAHSAPIFFNEEELNLFDGVDEEDENNSKQEKDDSDESII